MAVLPAHLPIELRAAIDLVARRAGCHDGVVQGRLLGDAILLAELRRYGREVDDADRLIALDASPEDLRAAIDSIAPSTAVTLSSGPLARPLRHITRPAHPLGADLPTAIWRSLGYERIDTVGLRGVGSLGWAFGERIFRFLDRPDIADRCRIGLLRCLTTLRLTTSLSTAVVRVYRRTGP